MYLKFKVTNLINYCFAERDTRDYLKEMQDVINDIKKEVPKFKKEYQKNATK